MPNLTFPGSPDGPLVDVLIAPSLQFQQLLKLHKRTLPTAVSTLFLIDTGASHSLVDADLIEHFGLTPRAPATMRTAMGTQKSLQYDLSLLIHGAGTPNRGQAWQLDAIPLTAVGQKPFGGERYAGLLGRDVLDRGLLIYNGVGQQIVLSW